MPLEHKGLVKLTEECAELITILMKRIGRSDGAEIHWDGKNLKNNIEEEIADVIAACYTVVDLHDLDAEFIANRMAYKSGLFKYWNSGGTATQIPWHKPWKHESNKAKEDI